MTAQDLKNSILQLAVEGKLLSRKEVAEALETTEGPKTGAELLEQIKAEKARLIAEGKIKKDTTKAGASGRALAEITEDEKPFDIPENWCWCRLGEILQSIQYGFNAPAKETGRIKMVRISDIQNGIVQWSSVPFCDISEEEIPTYLLKKNDILFARTGGTVGKSFIVKEISEDAIYAGYLIRTRYSDLLFHQYIKYFMESQLYWNQLREGTIATAQPNCNGQTLSKMILPLPPLAEQKRIVAKIEELLPYIQKYDVAHTKLEEFNKKFPVEMQKSILQQAIMGKLTEDWRNEQASLAKTNSTVQLADRTSAKDLLEKIKAEKAKSGGKATSSSSASKTRQKELPPITEEEIPFDIPESWCWCRLGEIGDWGAGATPQRGNPDYYQNGTIPWIKTGELNNGIVSEACEFITEKALNECSLRYNRVGDVLIAMYGATIGKLAIAGIELTTNQACCACTCHNGVYNKYLFYFLMSQKSVFEKKAEGGAQPNISREKIVKTLIPLPPLAEQKVIVAKIEELLPLCKKLVK